MATSAEQAQLTDRAPGRDAQFHTRKHHVRHKAERTAPAAAALAATTAGDKKHNRSRNLLEQHSLYPRRDRQAGTAHSEGKGREVRAIILLLLMTLSAQAGTGVCLLEMYDSNARATGSAVAIESDGDRQYFLTVAHNKAQQYFVHDGRPVECVHHAIWTAKPEDIRLLISKRPHKSSTQLRAKIGQPSVGDRVQVTGFPLGQQSRIFTTIKSIQSGYLVVDGRVNSGMSGGAVLADDGALLAIVSGTDLARNESYAASLRWATNAFSMQTNNYEQVRWNCIGGRCYPVFRSKSKVVERGSAGLFGHSYYREVVPPQSASPQPSTSCRCGNPLCRCGRSASTPTVSIDYDRLAKLVIEKYGDQLQGEDGLPGNDGPTGPRGPAGKDAPQIAVKDIADYLIANHLDDIRGPSGPTGPRGATGPSGSGGSITHERRVVVVGDPADYPSQPTVSVGGRDRAVIDDETYGIDDAFIFDVSRILK